MKFILALALLIGFASAYKSYAGYQVWRFDPKDHYEDLNNLFEKTGLDVWSYRRGKMDIMIPPGRNHAIAALLKERNLDYSIYISDVQSLIDDHHPANRKNIDPTAEIALDVYHTLDDINQYLIDLATDSFLVTFSTIGTSVEGRDINMVVVSTGGSGKQAIWLDCGAHAREWIAPATCIWGLDYLTNGYGSDQEVTDFLDSYDVYMVPVLNVDGYEYSWTDDRMWRKNRNPNSGGCVGVDLNRNYPEINWGTIGAAESECGETYRGTGPGSEPEIVAVQGVVEPIAPFVKAYFSIHSYSQLWLYAYGSDPSLPPENDDLIAASTAAVEAVETVYGKVYVAGNHYTAIYPASGTAVDYAYGIGIPHTYLPELRDEGEFGFILPEDQILPTAEEIWVGIFANVAAIP